MPWYQPVSGCLNLCVVQVAEQRELAGLPGLSSCLPLWYGRVPCPTLHAHALQPRCAKHMHPRSCSTLAVQSTGPAPPSLCKACTHGPALHSAPPSALNSPNLA